MKYLKLTFLFFLIGSLAYSQNERPEELNIIKPDSISSDKNVEIIAVPIVFYTPETNFGFGGGGQMFFLKEQNRFKNRISNILFSGVYTTNEQLMIEVTPQIYLGSGNYFIDANYSLEIYPNLFWGIGNNTPDSNEEVFKQTTHSLDVSFLKNLPNDLNFGFQFSFKNHQVDEIEEDGILDSGEILGSDRAVIVGLGALFKYDTRDYAGSPTKGFFYQFEAHFSSELLGATSAFNNFILDLREYLPVGQKSLLAFQIYLESNFGEVPFQALSSYGGGSRARGYFFGRFLDKQMYITQLEYRYRFKDRWTLNAFGLVGEVAEEHEDFFNSKNLKPAFGGGIRYKVFKDKDTWLRFDFGAGIDGNSGIYFGINEAF